MRKLALALLWLLAVPVEGLAQQAANFALVSPPTPARRYGMAGCGLGSVLLPNGPQVLTSIVNGLFWNQVFVISSGTSNCQNDTVRQAGLEQEQFMVTNYKDIARQAAQGDGEALEGLASELGCTSQNQKLFAKFTQKNHQKIFSQPGAIAALKSLKSELNQERTLAQSCKFAALSVGRGEVQ